MWLVENLLIGCCQLPCRVCLLSERRGIDVWTGLFLPLWMIGGHCLLDVLFVLHCCRCGLGKLCLFVSDWWVDTTGHFWGVISLGVFRCLCELQHIHLSRIKLCILLGIVLSLKWVSDFSCLEWCILLLLPWVGVRPFHKNGTSVGLCHPAGWHLLVCERISGFWFLLLV